MSDLEITTTPGMTIVASDTDRIKLVHYPPGDDWTIVHDDGDQTVRMGTMRDRETALDFAKDWLALHAREHAQDTAGAHEVSA